MSDKEKQASMKANIAQFARPNAAEDIVEQIVRVIS